MLDKLQARYIVGTCSFAASLEKEAAEDFQAILMAQVGPPNFYLPETSNPYVFGFHITSDSYPLPNVQSLGFLAQELGPAGRSQIPIRVLYRTKSEFFYSTCQSAIDRMTEEGFTDIRTILYDHSADDDGNGVINQLDTEFLEALADELCPPDQEDFHPAIFMCTLTEQDAVLRRLLENGCRPTSLWLTAATWNWADENPHQIPFLQGGGQWHEKFDYADEYFGSGMEMLRYNQEKFGYLGTYDQVVSYAIPILFAQHLRAAYRVIDMPDPTTDFSTNAGRERLRRSMLVLNGDTLFGPVAFNEYQRNIGREAAGTQWLSKEGGVEFRNALVSPFLQAEASSVVPAESAIPCVAGNFVNETQRKQVGSILADGCATCPIDTFTLEPSFVNSCRLCPEGSTTDGVPGSDQCYSFEDNLLSSGVKAFGYTAVVITWCLAIASLIWLYLHQKDTVVRVSQIEFLVVICIGTMISSSTVIALSVEAGFEEDTSRASAACSAAPFLYAIGWVLQYSSLSAKTFRLFQTMMNTKNMRRASVTAMQTMPIVIICLLIDLIIVITWTVKSPLVYERTEEGKTIDEENGLVIISSVGRCVSEGDDFWRFGGPLIGFHVLLMMATNALLCFVRDVGDRYQEQKYIAYASGLMFEILLVGIPVLLSVRDSSEATFIVLTGVIALDDIAVLLFVFGPKVIFQRQGLEEGVAVGESIMRESYKRATQREVTRASMRRSSKSRSSFSIPQDLLEEMEEEDSKGIKRRDSFSTRITGNDVQKQVWFSDGPEKSIVESIVEETPGDIQKEMDDEEKLMKSISSSSDDQRSRSTRSAKYMMTPAGIVSAGSFPGESATGSKLQSELTATDDEYSSTGKDGDVAATLAKQAKMIELAQHMMEQQEQLMKKTAAMMAQHEILQARLDLPAQASAEADHSEVDSGGSPKLDNPKNRVDESDPSNKAIDDLQLQSNDSVQATTLNANNLGKDQPCENVGKKRMSEVTIKTVDVDGSDSSNESP